MRERLLRIIRGFMVFFMVTSAFAEARRLRERALWVGGRTQTRWLVVITLLGKVV